MEQNYCSHCMELIADGVCPNCGEEHAQREAAPYQLPPNTVLNKRYIVGDAFREDDFGITYIGRDLTLDVRVAIKEYFPSGKVVRDSAVSTEVAVNEDEAQADFETGKANFLKRAKVMARFAENPHIVSVRDIFSANNTAYTVTECFFDESELLYDFEVDPEIIFEMVKPVIEALKTLHAQGLVCRCVAPHNILAMPDGAIKLMGIDAVCSMEEETTPGPIIPGYTPKEQYGNEEKLGPWTDVYALSAVIYRMLTATTPVAAIDRLDSDKLLPPSQICEYVACEFVPEELDEVLRKGMALQSEQRFASVQELETALWLCFHRMKRVWSPLMKPLTEDTEDTEDTDDTDEEIEDPTPEREIGWVRWFFAALAMMVTAFNICMSVLSFLAERTFCGVAWSFTGAIYLIATVLLFSPNFPRADNRTRRPNRGAFAAHMVCTFAAVGGLMANRWIIPHWRSEDQYLVFAGIFGALTLAVIFGVFYFPRLDRAQCVKSAKIYGGVTACLAVLLGLYVGYVALTTVSIGGVRVRRDTTYFSWHLDSIADKDLERLKKLENLERLEFQGCHLDNDDVELLGGLSNLRELAICYSDDVTDVEPLNRLHELTSLDLSGTGVQDISCLSDLAQLQTLKLSKTQVADLSALQRFSSLHTLEIASLPQLDADTISLPSSLITLDCRDDRLTTLDFLAPCGSLQKLIASNNQIADITSLKGCLHMENLDLSYNEIDDLSAVSSLGALKYLEVDNNKITSLSPLSACAQLFTLNVNCNIVSDVSALVGLTELHTLCIAENPVTDFSSLTLNDLRWSGGVCASAELYVTYRDEIDWAALAVAKKTHVYIYDTTAPQETKLKNMGYRHFRSSEELYSKKAG